MGVSNQDFEVSHNSNFYTQAFFNFFRLKNLVNVSDMNQISQIFHYKNCQNFGSTSKHVFAVTFSFFF
jgi:hypothetical protein